MKTKENLCKKIVLSIFFLLVLCRTAGAQDSQKATLTAADAGTCTVTSTACLIINIPAGSGGATFNVGANASANTVQFEASADYGTTWVALSVTPSSSTTTATSTTGTGAWQANVAGYTKARMRCSIFVGGTTTTYINLSTASARSGGGGGGNVSTNTINTYAGFLQDFGLATWKVPIAAASSATNNLVITSGGDTHFQISGADALAVGWFSARPAGGTMPVANGANNFLNASLCIENGTTFTCTDTGGITATAGPIVEVGSVGNVTLLAAGNEIDFSRPSANTIKATGAGSSFNFYTNNSGNPSFGINASGALICGSVGLGCSFNLAGGTSGNVLVTAPAVAGTVTNPLAWSNNQAAPGFYTSNGTACTNGELALSAGWQSTGSATVTAVAGVGQTCMWTITTGTTVAANPTITDTLVNPLSAATIVCEMNIHGGTGIAAYATDGPILQTSLSATAPIFTFQGTPAGAGATYFITRSCGP